MHTTSEIGHFSPDSITIRGQDLAKEILGKHDFVEVMHLCAVGRYPTEHEKNMIDALLVLSVDHGMTPSILAARLTHVGAPEAIQAAVAAGLLGAGTVLLGVASHAARQFKKFSAGLTLASSDEDVYQAALDLCQEYKRSRAKILGFGHPIHKAGDPRVPPMRQMSKDNGYYRVNWRLADQLENCLREMTGNSLALNAAGASGAILADMDLDLTYGGGLALIGRCAGLLGHLAEERKNPIANDVWKMIAVSDSRNSFPE
ncbi:citryl-CoA lyase [Bradyrhizobium arachidis]|uniref:citryl-CoA lyase n=1 Tax=Bradyrhizobium arachidis TaxID=858423 RepID=UPI0021615295|nr:citryl-CoA lyase [Bradyrhizobium arachidis]UVO35766.1 citryl-CoA lyase [Bradyrhizobium arachidis]